LLILVGAGAVAEYRAARGITVGAVFRTLLIAGLLYGVSAVAIRPYLASFGMFYTGFEPLKVSTSLVHYVTVLGFFLFAVVSLLAYETWLLRRRVLPLLATTPLLEQAGPAQGFWSPPNTKSWRLTWSTLVGYAAAAGVLVAIGFVVIGKIVPALVMVMLLFVAWLVPWHRQRPDRLLLLGMIAVALALTAAVELVVLRGDVGRMNTVFKFYLQVWVLLGLAAGIIAIRLLRCWRPGRASWQWWSAGAAVLLAACMIYPVQATPVKLSLRFDPLVPPTDDGMAYMRTAVYADKGQNIPLDVDYRAITWMQDNVPGSPVVLEANTGLYKWGSRVSVLTGLPTVVGWDWHQRQQRGDFAWMVEERVRDVGLMYESPDYTQLMNLLRKYHVEYVYVGPLERAYYSEAGLRKFRDLVGSVFDLVYVDPAPVDGVVDFTKGAQIYRVRDSVFGSQ
jgi:YYY domain-containing protein